MGYDDKGWEGFVKTIRREFEEFKTESTMRRIYCKKIIPEQGSS
jgi:hypothetical protein